MKSLVVVFILTVSFYSCSPQKVEEKENNTSITNTLIPKGAYISVPEECSSKVLDFKLIDQMSVKKYLFENDEISEEELMQKVILYFAEEPSEVQKEKLKKESVTAYWKLWTPPAENHPFGFVPAELEIKNFENVICLDFVKKIDTDEKVIEPNYLQKLKNID